MSTLGAPSPVPTLCWLLTALPWLCPAAVSHAQSLPVPPAASTPASDLLVEVPQKGLPLAGFRLDPQGAFAGAIPRQQPSQCDLWNLAAGAYVGQVPAARCRAWKEYTFAEPSEPKGTDDLGAVFGKPDPPAAGERSPDGKLEAVGSEGGIQVRESATKKAVRTLALRPGEQVLPGFLRWGTGGLLALTHPADESAGAGALYILYHFSELSDRAPRRFPIGNPVQSAKGVILDPNGRYCFISLHQDRVGSYLRVIDGNGTSQAGELSWWDDNDYGYSEEDSLAEDPLHPVFKPGRWLGGLRPYWETIEERHRFSGELRDLGAWRILAAPGDIRLVAAKWGSRLAPLQRDVKNVPAMTEQAAQELTQRFSGARKDTLRRLADGEELTLDTRGCAVSKHGVYSCDARGLHARVFRRGAEPLGAAVLRGDQLASVLYDAKLVEHFFAGAAIPQRPLTGLGQPPGLTLRGVARAGAPRALTVKLVATDGGDGVAEARARLGGRFLDWHPTLSAGKEAELQIPLPPHDCKTLWIYACNRAGSLCSRPARVPVCPRAVDADLPSRELDE